MEFKNIISKRFKKEKPRRINSSKQKIRIKKDSERF